MIKHRDIIGYNRKNYFRDVVLEEVLKFISEKSDIKIVKWEPPAGSSQLQHPNRKLKYNKKTNKIAVDSSIDSEAEEVIKELIKGNATNLKKRLPVEGRTIRPLYLFLDEEILLYARLKKLRFSQKKTKTDKISKFLDESEKKHPEVKRAVINSLLGMYNKT